MVEMLIISKNSTIINEYKKEIFLLLKEVEIWLFMLELILVYFVKHILADQIVNAIKQISISH